jgi:predicted amidohydrolase
MTVVAAVQLELAVGDWDSNRLAMVDAVRRAADAGAKLVVLPELADSGYVFASSAEARSLAHVAGDAPSLVMWTALAASYDLVIAGGFCGLGADGRLYNSAALVDASGPRAVYRKAHLWDTEKSVFTPGSSPPPVVEFGFGRVGLMICYDLEFPEWVRLAAIEGADLLAVPVNWPRPASGWPAGERPAEVVKAQAAAATNGIFVAVADRCGTERGVDWVSGSIIAGPGGYPLAGPSLSGGPDLLTAD